MNEEPEWLWEVWTQNGFVMGTGSLSDALKMGQKCLGRGDVAVIKTSTGNYIQVEERRT